ncbi:MAG: IS1634 family transposase [Deltaproteobacteria bacterium]|nr:IS1634 family transposase [Deltaproteobacteria bacterium]
MTEFDAFLDKMRVTRADHLPVIAAFCNRIGLTETIDRVVPTEMEVSVGTIIQGMILDTLSGRSPLYRLVEFFKHQDTEALLGKDVACTSFNDTTVGRAMDAVFDAGAEKVFSEVAFNASCKFSLDTRHVHFDTTSVNVWGEYEQFASDSDTLHITYGYSKDHRPDLKQFLIKMLCVGRNIPILGRCEDGNASDKSINNAVLSRISKHMAKYGLQPGAFVYIADSAMVTRDNLGMIGDNLFLTRLPFSYNEADRVVSEAVAENNWEEIGTLNETPTTAKRTPAMYSVAEKTVTLYQQQYRALVIHSTAHDKRRLKRIAREINASEKTLTKLIAQETKQEFYCRADAESGASRLRESGTELHRIAASVEEKVHYARGRPPNNGPRKVAYIRYVIEAKIQEKTEQIERKRKEAGCFVLLTNIPRQGDMAETGAELLQAYKEQNGIERNFSFLKDPLIVNDLFLKKPERIEALGAVLLMALMIWNLIEHTLRLHIKESGGTLPGWDNKPTRRPTTFMMSTKFLGIQIVRIAGLYRLAEAPTDTQRQYMAALGLSEADLLCYCRQLVPGKIPRK